MMMQMLLGGARGSVIAALGGNAYLTRLGAGTTISLSVNSDGTITATGVGTLSPDTINGDLWFNPATAGIGAGYWVRATVTSGSLSSGTAGSWISLASPVSWSRTQSNVGTSSVTLTIEIATDAAGANVVASGSFTITAERAS